MSEEKAVSYVPQIKAAYNALLASHKKSLAHALTLGSLLNDAKEALGKKGDAMLLLYDLYANDEEKKELRKCMRGFMRCPKPYYAELHAPIRSRLREHKVYVQQGLDPPDPDERRKGRAP